MSKYKRFSFNDRVSYPLSYEIKLKENKILAHECLKATSKDINSFTSLKSDYDTTIIVCHGAKNGGLSITMDELNKYSGHILIVCCHPAIVRRENENYFDNRIEVLGQWENKTYAYIEYDDDGGVYLKVESVYENKI